MTAFEKQLFGRAIYGQPRHADRRAQCTRLLRKL